MPHSFLVPVLSQLLVAAVTAAPPEIQLERSKDGKSIALRGLDEKTLQLLRDKTWTDKHWQELLSVRIDKRGGKDLPPMLGSYQIRGNVVWFEARFPFAPATSYRIVFDPAKLPEGAQPADGVVLVFQNQAREAGPEPQVDLIFPTRNQLPENQLKFYLHFNAPMSQADVYRKIRLLDEAGKEIAWPFLELDQQLWSPDGKRFTLFLDPGRVKQGLKPREDLGPSLVAGRKYTLEIDKSWRDADDRPLRATHRKSFSVGPPDGTCPSPKKWLLRPPTAGSRDALIVQLDESLDRALLEHCLWIENDRRQRLVGEIEVSDKETLWKFTPKAAWKPGTWQLKIDSRLEDLAGNSVTRPFEVDVFRPIQRQIVTSTTQLPFQIRD